MKRHLIWLVTFFYSTSLFAQNTGTGFPHFGSVQSGTFDAINLQNLNTHFEIPILSVPGRGIAFNFLLPYDSIVWRYQAGSPNMWVPAPDGSGVLSWGWQQIYVTGSLKYSTYTNDCVTCPAGGCGKGGGIDHYSTEYFGFNYTEPSGTVHSFNVSYYNVATVCNFPTGPRTGYATDGSGYYLSGFTVFSPGGHQVASSAQKTDPNGNVISASAAGSVTTWTNTLGVNVLIVDRTSNPVIYKYLIPSGAQQQIKVTNSTINIKTNFACSGVVDYTGSATVPTRVDYPDGSFYTMTYEPTPGFSGYYTGRLQRVTLPTGGYVEYDYTGANDGINCADGTTLGVNRVVNDGTVSSTWSYSRNPASTTTVTAPQLPYNSAPNQTVLTFDVNGHETSRKIYQGSAGGNLLRTINTNWSAGSPTGRITILENGSTQTQVETSYDGYGNLLSSKEHDWGSGAPGPIVRTATLSYLNSSNYTSLNILNRLTSKIIKDGAGNLISQTTYNL